MSATGSSEPQSPLRRTRPGAWRRWLANVLIVAGALVLAYPLGTWGYARWQQHELASRLAAASPAVAGEAESYLRQSVTAYTDDPDAAQDEARDVRQAGEEAARRAEQARLRESAQAFAQENGGQARRPLGRLLIPKIGVDVVVLEGTGKADLREGPGHWPETPFPGQGGNFVVSGHRTTYGAPFFKLDKLAAGDEFDLVLPYAIARYRIYRTMIVRPDETEVVAQRGVEEISLATCHPIYSAAQRLVVQAELIGFKLL